VLRDHDVSVLNDVNDDTTIIIIKFDEMELLRDRHNIVKNSLFSSSTSS